MSETSQDVGVLLKQERERKGIALDVVHEATKVPLDALKAIEEGYKVRTLTAFYYKSFVKIYAQYLGLDANHIVTLIPTHHPKAAAPGIMPRPGTVQTSSSSGSGAHRVEGTRTRSWSLLSHPIVLKKKRKVLKAALILVAAVIGIVIVTGVVRKISAGMASNSASTAARAPAREQVKKPAKVIKPEVSKASELKANAVKPAAEATSSVVDVKRVSITVRAQVSTWISVRVDGTEVFRATLKKGTASSWQGTKKIELSAKDISALEFEVNGRSIGKLSSRDRKAKKVVVTPAGLDVEK